MTVSNRTLPTIDFDIKGVSWSNGAVRCDSRADLDKALAYLRKLGYNIHSERERTKEGGKSVDDLVASGAALWKVTLDVNRTKCKSCETYIDPKSVMEHGHRCEHCGQVTYRHITRNSLIKFRFVGDNSHSGSYLVMRAWKHARGWLYLQPQISTVEQDAMSDEVAETVLNRNFGLWSLSVGGTGVLIKVCYPITGNELAQGLEPTVKIRKVEGHEFNFEELWLWDDVEYPRQAKDFPAPIKFNIFEAWDHTT